MKEPNHEEIEAILAREEARPPIVPSKIGAADFETYAAHLTADLIAARAELAQQASSLRASGQRIDGLTRDLLAAQLGFMKSLRERNQLREELRATAARLTRLLKRKRKARK